MEPIVTPLVSSLTQFGVAGVILAVLILYLHKLTNEHRSERKEWSAESREHINRFATIIEESTKAITELRSEVKENKCKMD